MAKKEFRHEVCVGCKTSRNVSKQKEIPKGGYVCPHCVYDRRVKNETQA